MAVSEAATISTGVRLIEAVPVAAAPVRRTGRGVVRSRVAAKQGDLFTNLSFENFKNSGERAIEFARVSTVSGRSGADRAQIFDALRLLRAIAQGRETAAFPVLWFGADWPTKLSIALSTQRHGRLTYSVTVQRVNDSRVRVLEERLDGRTGSLLQRRRHFYMLSATKEKYGVGSASFALYDAAKVLGADDPVVHFKRMLGDLWLINPDPNAMKSEIGAAVVNADTGDFADFATCMVLQQRQAPVVAAIREALLHLCPGLTGYSVELSSRGLPYLAVHHQGDLTPKGTPFAMIDNAEKIQFLVAFVCAMNKCSAQAPVVWLSPFNWLGERERAAAERLAHAAFAARGQMIMLG